MAELVPTPRVRCTLKYHPATRTVTSKVLFVVSPKPPKVNP